MKVLFIYFNKDFRPRIPITTSLLETIIKNNGHETKIFDTSFYIKISSDYEKYMSKSGVYKIVENLEIKTKTSDPYEDLRNVILNFNPNVIAFSHYSLNEDLHRSLLIPIKSEFPKIKIIAGGPSVCISPEKILSEPYIDFVCFGEGEISFLEFCNRIECEENINNISGIWCKDNGKIVRNGISPIINLNDLPIQNWESFDKIHINGFFDGRAYRMGHVEFIRGCPYNCTYCGSGSIKKPYSDEGIRKYVRCKDPKKAIEEYKYLKNKYNLEMFYFVAGTFTAMPINILEELSYLYKKEINLPFFALVRPETIKKQTAKLLGDMGCIHVSIGVESGVQQYRSEILNRKMTDEQIINSIKYLKDNNIKVGAYNMIGLPGMDREHVFKTIELNRKAKPDKSIVSIFIPMDNELTKSLINKNIIKKEDIKILNGTEPSIDINDMSKSEIVGLYNTFNLYIKFPKYFYPLIRILELENVITAGIRKILYKVIQWRNK